MWRGSTLTTHESDHLPITTTSSSLAPPSSREVRFQHKLRKGDREGFTTKSERKFAEIPLPTSSSTVEKVIFRRIVGHVRRYHTPCWLLPSPCRCATPHRRERSAKLRRPTWPCYSAAGPGHPEASSPGSRHLLAKMPQQDQNLRRLMRNVHHHHLVDPSYRLFDERGVAVSTRNAGSSTTQGSDGLSVLHLRHLGENGLVPLPAAPLA